MSERDERDHLMMDRHDFRLFAKKLKSILMADHSIDIQLAEALEILSRALGEKDWNTMSASLVENMLDVEGA